MIIRTAAAAPASSAMFTAMRRASALVMAADNDAWAGGGPFRVLKEL
jgi:hypothetical protein